MKQHKTFPETPRILAVVLTHERPAELQRCVRTAVASLGPDDLLVVLDDSSLEQSRANASWLTEVALKSCPRICHLDAETIQVEISRSLGREELEWQKRACSRDISSLRNLSLLLSASADPTTTVLIDDDICDFDLARTHQVCDDLTVSPSDGLIVGATIGNLTDLDTVTKISHAIRHIANTNNADPPNEMFRLDSAVRSGEYCMSAGYVAFRLPRSRLFAFPPGYNEDWLWCLLQRAAGSIHIVRMEEVQHDPFSLRTPTREDIHFEITGDLIFDCLSDCSEYGTWQMPELALYALLEFTPHPSSLPVARAATLLEELRELTYEQRCSVSDRLCDHGLMLLEQMLGTGEPDLDCKSLLHSWSNDAVTKQRSLAATIGNPIAILTVRRALEKESE